MIRSPWLRVYGMQLSALFRLAFAPAPGLPSLNLAAYRNSQVYSTKDTPPPSRAVTSCQSMVSGSISLPSPGFFSPFLHSTGSLSVNQEYLALEDGPPIFRQDTTCPALLTLIYYALTYTRVSLCPLCLSMQFYLNILYFWALSRSLAATWEISVDFFSSGY